MKLRRHQTRIGQLAMLLAGTRKIKIDLGNFYGELYNEVRESINRLDFNCGSDLNDLYPRKEWMKLDVPDGNALLDFYVFVWDGYDWEMKDNLLVRFKDGEPVEARATHMTGKIIWEAP